MPKGLSYPVFDADNHMYETTDAFTKYLPAQYEGLVKYVQVNGRTKIALRNVISEYIPNPTFNKVRPPGAQEIEFRIKNPSSKHSIGTATRRRRTPTPRSASLACRRSTSSRRPGSSTPRSGSSSWMSRRSTGR